MPDERARAGRRAQSDRFVSYDAEGASEHFASHGIRFRVSPLAAASGRIEFAAFSRVPDGVTCLRVAFEQPVEMVPAAGFEAYGIVLPLAGTTEIDLGEEVVYCGQPDAAIVDLQQVKALRPSQHSESFLVLIEQKALTKRLFELTGSPVTRKLRFTAAFDLDQPAIAALRAWLAGLDKSMLVPALSGASQSARRLSALLVDLVLEFLPHNYRDEMRRTPNLIAPKHVKRTVEYIQSHAQAPLAAEDLVDVAGVSLRALQYGFKKFLGVSISEYERSVRLDRARRDIERNPAEQVGVVARRWGFSNFTRFNTQFEAAFGVSAVALRASRSQQGHDPHG
jgi:AraC-like DNA-binding protein